VDSVASCLCGCVCVSNYWSKICALKEKQLELSIPELVGTHVTFIAGPGIHWTWGQKSKVKVTRLSSVLVSCIWCRYKVQLIQIQLLVDLQHHYFTLYHMDKTKAGLQRPLNARNITVIWLYLTQNYRLQYCGLRCHRDLLCSHRVLLG